MKSNCNILQLLCFFSILCALPSSLVISQENNNIIQLRNQPKYSPTELPFIQNRNILEKSRGFLFWRNADIKTFGIWVEAEGPAQPLNDPAELNKLLEVIAYYPISDIYVQVYRNGRAWFSSEYADAEPFVRITQKGRNPIAEIIDAAKKKSSPAKVHAWFNALRLGEDQKAKVFEQLGSDASLVSSRGESLFATKGQGIPGCRPDTPGIWLDPKNKKVPLLIIKLINELLAVYPSIDGVHLDMIRSPFPYSANEAISSDCNGFKSPSDISAVDTGENDRMENSGTTHLVKQVKQVIDTMYPGLVLSAAVLSNQKKAIHNANQPWPHWIDKDYVDYVVTMNYTDNMDRFEREVLQAKEYGVDRVSIGIGAWLAQNNPGLLNEQLALVKENNMKGIVLFSHGNLALDKGDSLYKLTTKEVLR